jgi:hypothetical protein
LACQAASWQATEDELENERDTSMGAHVAESTTPVTVRTQILPDGLATDTRVVQAAGVR